MNVFCQRCEREPYQGGTGEQGQPIAPCDGTGVMHAPPEDRIGSVYICPHWAEHTKVNKALAKGDVPEPKKLDPVSEKFKEVESKVMEFGNHLLTPAKTGSVLLAGPTGCGKTTLLENIIKPLVKRGARVEFRTVNDLFLEIRDSYRNEKFAASQTDIIEGLCSNNLLILDDLGAEPLAKDGGAWAESILVPFLEAAMDEGSPLSLGITTNLNGESLKSRYGDRVISRIIGASKTGECGFRESLWHHKDYRSEGWK